MRTQGMIQAGTPNPDGHVFFGISDITTAGTAPTFNRTSKGLYSLTQPVSAGNTYIINLAGLLFRYGVQDDLQMLWGSTANGGSQGQPTPPNAFVGQGANLQRPPYTGASQLVPPTSRPTGISIKNIIPVYQVLGVALNFITIGLSKTQFANGVAPVVTDVLAPATYGLTTTVNAQPVAIPVPVSTPNLFQTNRLSQLTVELGVNTPAGGTCALYGIFIDVVYNYN